MARLRPIESSTATPAVRYRLEDAGAHKSLGPNMLRTMACSPAVLRGYIGLAESLEQGTLTRGMRERIALTVSEINSSQYCLSHHTAAARLAGLTESDIASAREAGAHDPRTEAALRFARCIIAYRGDLADEEVADVRRAGWSDEEIAEIVAEVGLIVFTNYFNAVAQTEPDVTARELNGKDIA